MLQIQARQLANISAVRRESVYQKLKISPELKSALDKEPLLSKNIFNGKFAELYGQELDKSSKQAMVKIAGQGRNISPRTTQPSTSYADRKKSSASTGSTYKIPLKRKLTSSKTDKSNGGPPAKKAGFRPKRQ